MSCLVRVVPDHAGVLRRDGDWRIRLIFAVIGAFALGVNLYSYSQIEENSRYQLAYSRVYGSIVFGVVCLIVSVFPWNRILAKLSDS